MIEGEVNLNHAGKRSRASTWRTGHDQSINRDDSSERRSRVESQCKSLCGSVDGFGSLKHDLNAIQQPGVRNSTHLLDLMPENTVVYAAVT